jgi:outer membrane biosynthesis protein TonB
MGTNMDTTTTTKPKTKTKPKPKQKPKPKPEQKQKQKPKQKPEQKQKSKPKKEPSLRKITVEYSPVNKDTLDENKYSGKLNKLLYKIKSQHTDTDNRIRFCWKN